MAGPLGAVRTAGLLGADAGEGSWLGTLNAGERERLAGIARHYLRCRTRRGRDLVGNLFADPAWDMLLDLFAARMEGNKITKSSAYIASGVPNATAHRIVAKLLHAGHVRETHGRDGRCIFLTIEDMAASAVGEWLDGTFAG